MNKLTVTVTPTAQAPAQSSIAQATQATPSARFCLIGRPERGHMLFAHTAAVFAALGLFEGATVKRNTLLRIWGASATNNHKDKFEICGEDYALSEPGFIHFGEHRNVKAIDSADMFYALITTGKGPQGVEVPHRYQAVKPI